MPRLQKSLQNWLYRSMMPTAMPPSASGSASAANHIDPGLSQFPPDLALHFDLLLDLCLQPRDHFRILL
jgi:hypothetical protein